MLPGNPSRCARAPEEASFRLCSSAIRACRSAWKNVFKKKITFPTLNCDNISGLHELYTKKEAKKKKKTPKSGKKKLTQTSGGEKCLWGTWNIMAEIQL